MHKPHVITSDSVKKIKSVKINTNDIIFYLDINFYIHVLKGALTYLSNSPRSLTLKHCADAKAIRFS